MAFVPPIAAAAAARRNRIMRCFAKAGAVSPERAETLEQLGITNGHIVRRMVKGGVLKETTDNRFWLDQAADAAFQRRARKAVAIAIGCALLVVGLLILIDQLVR